MSFQLEQYHGLKVSIDKHVALIVMSRPDAYNCWDAKMPEELIRVYEGLETYPHVRVIVITGDPAGKCFCAGADLNQHSATPGQDLNVSEEWGGRVALTIQRSRKITIAAINGSAAGIGITMTLPMDLRFACKDSKIAFPFVQRGVVPEGKYTTSQMKVNPYKNTATSTYHLPLLIGRSRAMAVLLQGNPVTASSPLLDGLFAKLLETKESVLPYALNISHELSTSASPTSIAYTKSLLLNSKSTAEEQHILESRAMFVTRNGDAKEGIKSYFEKRPPCFKDYDTRALPEWLTGKL